MDPLTIGLALGAVGAVKYAGDVSANDSSKKYNATINKWAPLLSLYGEKGAPNKSVPTANLGQDLMPAVVGAGLAGLAGSGGLAAQGGATGANAAAAGLEGSAVDDADTEAAAMGGGSSDIPGTMTSGTKLPSFPTLGNVAMNGMPPTVGYAGGGRVRAPQIAIPHMPRSPMMSGRAPGAINLHFAGGGRVQPFRPPMAARMPISNSPYKFAGGGDTGSSSGSNGLQDAMSMGMKLAPIIAMMASNGGQVPGKAKVAGNSPKNDTQMTQTSPGEVVLPRDVSKDGLNGKTWKVAAYLNEVKKHGPGPMPVKNYSSSQDKPQSNSVSPWKAMAGGGKTKGRV
jgi:hypothetical protein